MKQKKEKNLILLGFMGSGKTSVGKLLANDLNLNFLELDNEIERNSGLLINEIFNKFGEKYFRDLEKKELQKFKNITDSVISLGGGTFCAQENIGFLKEIGLTVYLKSDYSTLIRRYSPVEISKRPLLKEAEKVNDLLIYREQYYSQADLIIESNNMNPAEIKEDIINSLRDRFNFAWKKLK